MMEITIKETAEGILVSGLTLFSLDDTLDCGQCFRFHREEGGWRGAFTKYGFLYNSAGRYVRFVVITLLIYAFS